MNANSGHDPGIRKEGHIFIKVPSKYLRKSKRSQRTIFRWKWCGLKLAPHSVKGNHYKNLLLSYINGNSHSKKTGLYLISSKVLWFDYELFRTMIKEHSDPCQRRIGLWARICKLLNYCPSFESCQHMRPLFHQFSNRWKIKNFTV